MAELPAAQRHEVAQFIEDSGALMAAAGAAVNALRSYQYGNSSPVLAEEIADALEAALRPAQRSLLAALAATP